MGDNWFNTNTWQRINYTLWAPLYDHFVRKVFGARRRRSLELLEVQSGQRLLIVGAGTGLDLEYLPPALNLSITAIDLTPAMLRRLQARARLLGLTVDTQVMDGQVLTFPDASFDLVVLHLIMAVIPEPMRCIREVARVLRPGGRVVVLDKFIPDEQRPPWLMRLLNPLTRFGGTEITRKLGPILSEVPLRIVHQEPAGFHGFMKIVLLETTPASPGTRIGAGQE